MADAANVVESVRQVVQDFLAPELRGLKAEVGGNSRAIGELGSSLRGDIRNLRDDLHQMETRMIRYVDTRMEELREIVRLRERLAVVQAQIQAKHA